MKIVCILEFKKKIEKGILLVTNTFILLFILFVQHYRSVTRILVETGFILYQQRLIKNIEFWNPLVSFLFL